LTREIEQFHELKESANCLAVFVVLKDLVEQVVEEVEEAMEDMEEEDE
jgi:hypothetical protein